MRTHSPPPTRTSPPPGRKLLRRTESVEKLRCEIRKDLDKKVVEEGLENCLSEIKPTLDAKMRGRVRTAYGKEFLNNLKCQIRELKESEDDIEEFKELQYGYLNEEDLFGDDLKNELELDPELNLAIVKDIANEQCSWPLIGVDFEPITYVSFAILGKEKKSCLIDLFFLRRAYEMMEE